MSSILETERLRLREWHTADRELFARMNEDPRVMEFMLRRLNREETEAMIARIRAGFAQHGFGLWAVEVNGGAPFIGYVGLAVPRFESGFTPCVEIGWRLAYDHWGHGYATEAARKALQFGFTTAGLPEIVSFTVPANTRSRRVMERLGMRHDPREDFDHPQVPNDHPLRRHVLYRISRDEWMPTATAADDGDHRPYPGHHDRAVGPSTAANTTTA